MYLAQKIFPGPDGAGDAYSGSKRDARNGRDAVGRADLVSDYFRSGERLDRYELVSRFAIRRLLAELAEGAHGI